jgi:heat shock protein 4
MLNRLKMTVSKNNLECKEMVISVPNYFTQQERLALLDACKVSEIKVQRLLNESAAIALQYGLYRRSEFK